MTEQCHIKDGDTSSVVSIPRLLTPRQVAEALQIPVKSVHALCRAGKLGYVQIDGKSRRFTFEQIAEYIAAKTASAYSPLKAPVP
jgi:excisionase family DNA binding protein